MSTATKELPARRPHPNMKYFTGVLTLVDMVSDSAPKGTNGHPILLPRAATEEALWSLEDMAIDYKDGFEGHDRSSKIGIIKEAWIDEEGKVRVAGFLYARDFKEVIAKIEKSDRQFGMSYELADAHVESVRASVWRLKKFIFTGAAVLYCDKAAYQTSHFCISANAEPWDGRFSFIDACEVTGSGHIETA